MERMDDVSNFGMNEILVLLMEQSVQISSGDLTRYSYDPLFYYNIFLIQKVLKSHNTKEGCSVRSVYEGYIYSYLLPYLITCY